MIILQENRKDKDKMNTQQMIGSIHPGEILREDFLEPMKLTPYRLAKSIGVPQTRISEILKGERSISADTALRFARFFGTSAQLWLNLQNHYDLEMAGAKHDGEYDKIPAYA